MTARDFTEKARIAGIKVGRAIARDHLADGLRFAPGEFELSPEDVAAIGLDVGSVEFRLAEEAAEAEYYRRMVASA